MVFLLLMMLSLLLRPALVMDAASAACRLFVSAVLPGLMPYMVLSQMLISRMKQLSPALMLLLGWGGGSPTGARLIRMRPDLPRKDALRIALSCATMSPMFLLGTVGQWLESSAAGAVVFFSVLTGGWLTGRITCLFSSHWKEAENSATLAAAAVPQPLSFGASIEAAARTMLLVCGTMIMLRVFAALAGEVLPAPARLPMTALLEVTTGAAAIAVLPLPLAWRTALTAGVCGFGGAAIILQNRAVAGEDFLPPGQQIIWQAVHGVLSFLITLGMMLLLC